MIDNTDKIIDFIKFESTDVFWAAKIIVRSKDFDDKNEYEKVYGSSSAAIIQEKVLTKTNYIDYIHRMVELAKYIPKSRVYLNINPKCFSKANKKIIELYSNGLIHAISQKDFILMKYVSKITRSVRSVSDTDFNRNHNNIIIDSDTHEKISLPGNFTEIKTINGHHYIYNFKEYISHKNKIIEIAQQNNLEIKENALTLVFAN